MSQQLLQINFQFSASNIEYEKATITIAEHFATIPGLQWKIWIVNKDRKEAGGIYLFESTKAIEAYKGSLLFRGLRGTPGLSNITVKEFGLLEEHSVMTNAPLSEQAISN